MKKKLISHSTFYFFGAARYIDESWGAMYERTSHSAVSGRIKKIKMKWRLDLIIKITKMGFNERLEKRGFWTSKDFSPW